MTEKHSRMSFTSMPVRDPKASRAFFEKLGFTFNDDFGGPQAASMILNPQCTVMFIEESVYKTLTKKALCEMKTTVEAAFGFFVATREEVDALVKIALENGATRSDEGPADHGSMYTDSFDDLDGHHWEILQMSAPPKG